MAPDDELVNLIDFSAHGPDRGQLFVESYPIRPAPPLVSAGAGSAVSRPARRPCSRRCWRCSPRSGR
jgi:hypothetical protein